MATNYPTSIDSFTNPGVGDYLDTVPHDGQHADANDAIEALEAKVGVSSSTVKTSLDWKTTAHGVRAKKSAAQSITSATPTALTFDQEDWDDADPYHDNATTNSRFIVPTGHGGVKFRIRVVVEWASNATGYRQVELRKNGGGTAFMEVTANAVNGVVTVQHLVDGVVLADADYFEVFVTQNSGSPLNVQNNFTSVIVERVP